MVSYKTQIKITESVDSVYTILTDHVHSPRWITGLKKVESLTAEGVRFEKGAAAKYTFSEKGKEIVFDEVLLDIKPRSYFSFRMESPQVVMETDVHLREMDGKTEVLMKNQVSGKGIIMKLMLPLMKGTMIKRQNQDLSRLKQYIEQ